MTTPAGLGRSIRAIAPSLALALPMMQALAQSGTFVVLQRRDTIAVESFSIRGDTLSGQIAQRGGQHTRYTARLRADGTIGHIDVVVDDSSEARESAAVDFAGSEVRVLLAAGADTVRRTMPATGLTMPGLGQSYALFEQMLRARDPGRDTIRLSMFNIRFVSMVPITMARIGTDSVRITLNGREDRIAIGALGDLRGGRRTNPTGEPWIITRVDAGGTRPRPDTTARPRAVRHQVT